MRTNMTVNTPLGKGTVQGRWSETEWLIRIPINDITRARLIGSITPHATYSGLWVFSQTDIK